MLNRINKFNSKSVEEAANRGAVKIGVWSVREEPFLVHFFNKDGDNVLSYTVDTIDTYQNYGYEGYSVFDTPRKFSDCNKKELIFYNMPTNSVLFIKKSELITQKLKK